ncbi:MAG: bifunctional oligoribonuclease/PAP phosphatase NrnA [Acidimicrobiia bacterium]
MKSDAPGPATIDAALWQVARLMSDAPSVALACHVSPDGDALGSMLGLFHALREAGRTTVASFSEPFVTAPHYRELPGLDLLTPPGDFPDEPELMITFDTGSFSRLGGLESNARNAEKLVVMDHHISNERYGTLNVIDPDAAATGMLVHRLIRLTGLPLNNDAAVCLYAALVCDTGRFQYEATTAETFEVARDLMGFDIPVSRLSRTLFEEHRMAYLKLLGEALGRAELVGDKDFVWTSVSRADRERFGVEFDEIEGLIDILRRTAEARITCVVKEGDDGVQRVSLRAIGDADVHRLAVAEGGGGHRYAAGFSTTDDPETVVARILREL